MSEPKTLNASQLRAVADALGDISPAEGLLQRTVARTQRRRRRRNWITGSTGVLGTIAVTLTLVQSGNQLPGQITFAMVGPSGTNGVSLVGDFNDWDASRNRLELSEDNEWMVTLQLDPGRYRFAYVTDSGDWLSDPNAPPALDEFGTPTSVLTVPTQ